MRRRRAIRGRRNWQTLRHVVLPIIAPSLIGVALFGFTLSYDEFARTLLTAGCWPGWSGRRKGSGGRTCPRGYSAALAPTSTR